MLNPGDRFGDYTVERLLGKGGMGAVYLLKNADGGLVAAKILDPASAGDHESRKRFLREAELALGVKHPNLVETYDVGEDPDTGLCYILMEYVSGGSLADVAVLAFCELGYPNEMRLAIDEGLKNDPDFSRYKLMSGRLVEASSGREASDPNGFVAKAKLFAACEELRRKTPDFVERWAERAKTWKGVPTELDFARALSDISGQDVPALFARHGIVLDQAGNGGPGEPPKAVVAAEQPKSNHGEQEFDWEKWFSDTVPVGAELAALQNNKAWLVRAAIEEKIGKLKAVREELKAAFDDVAKAQTAYVGGQAVAKHGRLVTKFQKLKTSPTGRSRLQLWEEQSEIVDVAEARFKLLEWLAYVKVEDGPARSAVMKALNAAQRDLKRQIPKLEKLKKQAGVEF